MNYRPSTKSYWLLCYFICVAAVITIEIGQLKLALASQQQTDLEKFNLTQRTSSAQQPRLAPQAETPQQSTLETSPTLAPEPELTQQAVVFARWLRYKGVGVTIQNCVTYLDALETLSRSDRLSCQDLYWAGRIALLSKPADLEQYDAAFTEFWAGCLPLGPIIPTAPELIALAFDSEEASSAAEVAAEQPDPRVRQINIRYSPQEVLRDKDFAKLTDQELAEVKELITKIPASAPTVNSRRLRPSNQATDTPDIRRTVRFAMRTEGELLKWLHQKRRLRQRGLVLLLDVSGSMSLYAQALLRFAHAIVCARQKVEVFSMGTRLTRLTRQLSVRNPEEALTGATASVKDWSGGTRLGETLESFNNRWGIPGMARGAVVVILSDGWDRGKPAQISEQMLRLSRVAYKIIWVNPLKATPDYAPLAQGMAAALPHVDWFIEGHSLNALEELAELISQNSVIHKPRSTTLPAVTLPAEAIAAAS